MEIKRIVYIIVTILSFVILMKIRIHLIMMGLKLIVLFLNLLKMNQLIYYNNLVDN